MIPIQKNLTRVNYRCGTLGRIEYIVVHFTANDGDTARANTCFFRDENRGASAHYFVDENSIWQCVEDKDVSWHCGGGRQSSCGGSLFKICTNSNSIGIEMCSRKKNGHYYFKEGTVENCIELVRTLMTKYQIPLSRIVRHYDVTGKICPEPYCYTPQGEEAWKLFKERILNGEEEFTVSQYQEIMEKLSGMTGNIEKLTEKINGLEHPMIYNYMDNNMPEWSKPTIQKLMDKKVLLGNNDGELGLDYTTLRILSLLDRAGVI